MKKYRNARPWKSLGHTAFLLAPCFVTPAMAQTAESGKLEEIIVTGSYIRRDSFEMSSPLDVVSSQTLAETGAAKIGETLYNQTFNFGVSRVQNYLAGGQLTDGTITSSNLRGLGGGATLNLMNGKRTLTDANFGYPQMAVERIETLLDGASALYGSNAIAGVQNFVPYTRFNGVQMMADYREREQGGGAETLLGLMAGFSNDTDNLVFSLELQNRDAVYASDIPKFTDIAPTVSGAGHPGSYLVPQRDANGALTGTTLSQADPTCGNQTNNPGNRHSIPGNRPFGTVAPGAGGSSACSFYYGEFWDFQPELDATKAYLHYDHKFGERVTFNVEAVFDQRTDNRRGSPVDFGANAKAVHQMLSNGVIPGEHPGNPYRAMNSAGQPLFALDANGDGMPDRDANNQVVLSSTPTDSTSGIGFNEDVRFSGWRPLGKDFQGLPTVSNADNSSPLVNKATFSRYNVGFDIEITDNWFADVDYTYNRFLDLQTRADASLLGIAMGLEGRLGPNQDQWFNPFGTSQIRCADRVCGSTITQPDDPGYNSQFVMDQVAYRSTWNSEVKQQAVDLVVSNSQLFPLPGGQAGLAVGLQLLDDSQDYYADSHRGGCDSWSLGCDSDFNDGRRTNSYFAEFSLPLMDNRAGRLNVDLAGRLTDVDEMDSSFDPKVGLVYSPIDILSLRASWGTSFQAPTLRQQKATTNVTRDTIDPTCALSGGRCSPTTANFVVSSVAGNPSLEPETAESYTVGFALRLLEGDLSLKMDYVNIDYTDRITEFPAVSILDADAANYAVYVAAQCPGTPTNACMQQAHENWTTGLNDPRIQYSGPQLGRVITSYINAAAVETSQVDIALDYRLDLGRAGQLRLGANATNVRKYEYQSVQNGPVVDATGKTNEGTVYPALPEWTVAPRINWSLGAHSVLLSGQYHNGVFVRNIPGGQLNLPAYSRFDLSYSYDFSDLLFNSNQGRITVGAINAFDQLATPYSTPGGYNAYLEDPFGRTWYARFTTSF